jgi:hypothetical protein
MRTEHLHQTLSPRAHAALIDALQRQAERERRAAVQGFGQTWAGRLSARVRHLAAHRVQGTPAVRLMEG